MQVDQTVSEKTPNTAAAVLDGDAVSKYLNLNPEFFVVYEDLLPRLRIPHSNGKAVSLIEKQVDVLRGQCSKLENRLTSLISVARQNEELHTRLHVLIQAIISAASLDDIVTLTRSSLLKNFNADQVRIFLNHTVIEASVAARVLPKSVRGTVEDVSDLDLDMGMDLALDLDLDATIIAERVLDATDVATREADCDTARPISDADMALFKTLFESQQTVCGVPDAKQLKALGCENATDMGSAALVPLWHETGLGLMLISSADESRFDSGKGVMFLNQLGELLSRRLHSLSVDHSLSEGDHSSLDELALDKPSAEPGDSASAT